jgi:hypothetical protein
MFFAALISNKIKRKTVETIVGKLIGFDDLHPEEKK